MAGAWLRELPRKGLREGLEGLEGLRAGKRQAWTPLQTDGWGVWLWELPWKGLREGFEPSKYGWVRLDSLDMKRYSDPHPNHPKSLVVATCYNPMIAPANNCRLCASGIRGRGLSTMTIEDWPKQNWSRSNVRLLVSLPEGNIGWPEPPR